MKHTFDLIFRDKYNSTFYQQFTDKWASSLEINKGADQLSGTHIYLYKHAASGLFPAILGKGPWPKLGKNDQLNSKIGRN